MYVTLSDSISKLPRWTFSLDNCSSWIYTFDAIHPFFLILWKLKLKQMLLKLRPNSGAPSQPAFYKIDCDWISGEVKENWPIDTTSMKMVWWLYLAPATYLVSPHTLGQKPTFYSEITKNLMFQKCEFCEKLDFEIVNFVTNETLRVWILSKMRFWKCEFCQKMIFWNVNFWINWGFLPQCATPSFTYFERETFCCGQEQQPGGWGQ